MKLKSLGYRADLAFPGLFGEIVDRGDYLAVRTPQLPGFFMGNMLVFAEPPATGNLVGWSQHFKDEFGEIPGVRHETFGWDSPEGELGETGPFEAAGFAVLQTAVMTARDVASPPHFNPAVETIPAASAAHWDDALLCESGYTAASEPNPRIAARLASYKKQTGRGVGAWYGAYLEGRLAGGLGIYKVGRTGVIDSVSTRPELRGRGVARTAVYQAARHALAHLSIEGLLLGCDQDSAAQRLYGQLGFATVQNQVGLLKV